MSSEGSKSLFEVEQLGRSIFAFVDADNFKKSLERALTSRAVSTDVLHRFPVIDLLTAPRIDRYYVYSAVEHGKDAAAWIADIRSQSKFIFRQSLLRSSGGQKKQEGVDVMLALEAIKCAYKKTMDACVVFSDDGDLLPLVNALVEEGIMTAVVSFGNPEKSDVAARLRDASDEYYHIGTSILTNIYNRKLRIKSYTSEPGVRIKGSGQPQKIEMGQSVFFKVPVQRDEAVFARKDESNDRWYYIEFANEEDATTCFALNDGWPMW